MLLQLLNNYRYYWVVEAVAYVFLSSPLCDKLFITSELRLLQDMAMCLWMFPLGFIAASFSCDIVSEDSAQTKFVN